jgi:hypothetical protein
MFKGLPPRVPHGVIADAELEEDAGYIEHILFMSMEWPTR